MTSDEKYMLEKLEGIIGTLATNAHGIKVRLERCSTELAIALLTCPTSEGIGERVQDLSSRMTATPATGGEGSIRATFSAMSEDAATGFAEALFDLYVSLHHLEVEAAINESRE